MTQSRPVGDSGATNVLRGRRRPTPVSSLVIDSFAAAAPWTAADPVGAPSAEIALTAVADTFAPVGNASSLRVEVTSAGGGHRVERNVVPIDLTTFDELRWWVRADRISDGSPLAPMRLRIELGSAALPIGSAMNTWHRLVPVNRPNTWEFVSIALDDLDPQVAGAADTIRFTVVDHSAAGIDPAMTVWLDELIACRPQLVTDPTAALVDLLDGHLVLTGPVPAALFVPGGVEPAPPWIRVAIDDVAFCDRRTVSTSVKSDFVDAGYRLRSESIAYDLRYRIEPATADPAEYVAIVDFVIATLAHRRTLLVGGLELALDRLPTTKRDRRRRAPLLRYVVAARTERTDNRVFAPVAEIELLTDVATS